MPAKKKEEITYNGEDTNIDRQTECLLKLNHIERATYDLYEAIADNDFDSALKAIQNGAQVNASVKPCFTGGGTPLDSAVFWADTYDCSTRMIEFLRKHGATNYDQDRAKYVEEAGKCPVIDEALHKKKFKK